MRRPARGPARGPVRGHVASWRGWHGARACRFPAVRLAVDPARSTGAHSDWTLRPVGPRAQEGARPNASGQAGVAAPVPRVPRQGIAAPGYPQIAVSHPSGHAVRGRFLRPAFPLLAPHFPARARPGRPTTLCRPGSCPHPATAAAVSARRTVPEVTRYAHADAADAPGSRAGKLPPLGSARRNGGSWIEPDPRRGISGNCARGRARPIADRRQ